MTIAIIGETSLHERIESMLTQFIKTNKINLKPMFFENETKFQLYVQQQTNFSFKILFLIQSSNNSAMFDFATAFKAQHPECEIIFSSKTTEFAVEGYKINLAFYLLQPFSYNEFVFALNKCLKNFMYNLKYITVNSNWQKIKIAINQIQFAEKLGRNVIIKTTNETISTRCTFKDFLKKFQNNDNFINCVKGALVNLNWVDSVESQNFLMKTGDRISIRRKDRKKIKQIYNNFLIQKNFAIHNSPNKT